MNSMSRELDSGTADELLARQAALQRQAGKIIADLDLVNLLTIVGQPMLLGSAMTGLMVWQDIDVIVLCPRLDPGSILGRRSPALTSHPCVKKLRWSNVRGPFNLTGVPRSKATTSASIIRKMIWRRSGRSTAGSFQIQTIHVRNRSSWIASDRI